MAKSNTSGHQGKQGLTNLMATVWELRRLVPVAKNGFRLEERTGESGERIADLRR